VSIVYLMLVSLVKNKDTTVESVAVDTAALAGAAVGSVLAVILVIVAIVIIFCKA